MNDFSSLTPDAVFAAAEHAFGCRFSGVMVQHPSYINRVYELEDLGGNRYVFKFYRPGRWSYQALLEEHIFLLDCRKDELPVVAPLLLRNRMTLDRTEGGIYFAAFPRRWGRSVELETPESYRRAGALIARVHQAGRRREAVHRLRLDPRVTTLGEVAHLLTCGIVPTHLHREFEQVLKALLKVIVKNFRQQEFIRIHGDCHKNNILEHLDDGLMLIDFDDMMTGAPLQDLWLLLPGRSDQCPNELAYLLDGYRSIGSIDHFDGRDIEIYRAMRMIYFLSWCAGQRHDYNFLDRFPAWAEPQFFRREISNFAEQLTVIEHQ